MFRFEPFNLSVECVNIAAAQRIVAQAILAGFKESSATKHSSRVMVDLRYSICLEVHTVSGWGATPVNLKARNDSPSKCLKSRP